MPEAPPNKFVAFYNYLKINRKKVLIAVTTAILIIIAGIFLYFFLQPEYIVPSQNTTVRVATTSTKPVPNENEVPAEWANYKNIRFGYEVDYPKNWVISPLLTDGQNSTQAITLGKEKLSFVSDVEGLPNQTAYIEVITIPVDYTFEQWWKDRINYLEYSYSGIDLSKINFPRDTITIDSFDKSRNNLVVETTKIFWKDNFIFVVSLKDTSGIENNPLTRILSSFKPSPNKQLLAWKEYKDSSGISFQIPELVSVVPLTQPVYMGEISYSIDFPYEGGPVGFGASPFYFGKNSNQNLLSIPDWYQQENSKLPENERSTGTLKSVKIGQYSGYKRESLDGDHTDVFYYVANRDKIFTFTYYDFPLDNNPDNTWTVKMYEQIINSIKFD